MGIPARAARPLVALAIAAASLGCIAHPAYAENATAAVVSDDGSHIVVDVDLNGGASDVGSDRQGAAEKAHGEGVAAGIKAQAEAYNGMDNPYLLANRYIDIMPKVAEQVAKPLTAVDSIKMYGSGNAQKLVRETTSIVDQVASGLKDSTGIDLPSLLNGLISNPDIDADSAENSVE